MAEDLPTKVPFGLWVDGDGVAHRLRIDEQGGSSMTIEYYDFGLPVEITPPPADEIMSDEEFFNEVEQHAGDANCDNGDGDSNGSNDSASGSDTFTDGNLSGGVRICLYATTVGGG